MRIIRFFGIIFILITAFTIITVSILRSTSIRYSFTQKPLNYSSITNKTQNTDYKLPTPSMLPTSPLWPLAATRDKINLALTRDKEEKAEVMLQLADHRLASAFKLMAQGDYEAAVSVLQKAEKYLLNSSQIVAQISAKEAKDKLNHKLAIASIKHREVLEYALIQSPEDARPIIAITIDTPKIVYDNASTFLKASNITPPENPFN